MGGSAPPKDKVPAVSLSPYSEEAVGIAIRKCANQETWDSWEELYPALALRPAKEGEELRYSAFAGVLERGFAGAPEIETLYSVECMPARIENGVKKR